MFGVVLTLLQEFPRVVMSLLHPVSHVPFLLLLRGIQKEAQPISLTHYFVVITGLVLPPQVVRTSSVMVMVVQLGPYMIQQPGRVIFLTRANPLTVKPFFTNI